MSQTKIIFGFTGLPASGKGTAASYLKNKYNASIFGFSKMLRDLVDRLYLPQSRDNLIKISEVLRAAFGEDIMAKTMANDVAKDSASIVVIEGIRRLADVQTLLPTPYFVLTEIFADPKVRYSRIVKRGENVDDKQKTYIDFLADHQRSTELSILEIIKLAKERIDNNSNENDLHRQLDALVKKYVS